VAENDDASSTSDAGDEGAPAAEAEGGAPAEAVPENRRARRAAAATSRRKGGPARPVEPRPGTLGGLDATERVDDALSRATDRSVRFLKSNFNIVQYLIVGAAAGWIGWQIYSYRSDKTAAKVADLISDAVAAENGRLGEPDEEGTRDARGSIDARRVFKTDEDRLKAAREGYEKVVAERPGTPAASLAKLGLAGLLYDQGKFDDAKRAYEEAYGSDLAKVDPEVKGRSLEGIGLSLEAKGDADGALKRFGELENLDVSGFRELALYHQARLLHAKGDDAGAKERLKKVVDKLGKQEKKDPTAAPGEGRSYLGELSKELLQRIDPKAVPPPSSEEALQKALEEFQKKLPAGVSRVPAPVPMAP
jgi:tetratricopeptide (TPR) repeat protein